MTTMASSEASSAHVLSLHERYVTFANRSTGKDEQILALHPRRTENVNFLAYIPIRFSADKTAVDEWMEQTDFIKEDLRWLLKLPHDKFWCQVVFDKTLHRCIDSYLSDAPRIYDISPMQDMSRDVRKQQEQLHRLFFMVCLRMATHKESKDDHISPKVFGDIIYDNFIFDIPKLMDLCAIYGSGNDALLSKMIGNVFTQQPKYLDDLSAVVPTILSVYEAIRKQCGSDASLTPAKLQTGSSEAVHAPLRILPVAEVQNLLMYILDIAYTLNSFLQIYPQGSCIFADENFLTSLAHTYEIVVVGFNDAFDERDWETAEQTFTLRCLLRRAQVCLLKSFRQIVYQSCLLPMLECSKSEVADRGENFLNAMTAVLSERRFLAHHQRLFPFADDRDMLGQTSYEVDEERLQFIQDAVSEACALYGSKSLSHTGSVKPPLNSSMADARADYEYEAEVPDDDEDLNEVGACTRKVKGVELESMIMSVKDLLPDLGEGFIQLCLEEYGYNAERVINAVLEDKLRTSLRDVDRSLPRFDDTIADAAESVLEQRRNVFDNDQFDVFSRSDVDLSRVHRGKKDRLPTDVEFQQDKSELVSQLKPLFDKYGGEFVESMYDKKQDYEDEYEDEYDDTYDSNVVGAHDADSADELTARRQFVLPRILQKDTKSNNGGDASDDDNDEEDDAENGRQRRDLFIEDPAKLRQIQEQRRADMLAQRGGHRRHQPPTSGAQTTDAPAQKSYDVKGAAKGQGQTNDVLRNRAWKEKNKASRVNHNRRDLADKKRRV